MITINKVILTRFTNNFSHINDQLKLSWYGGCPLHQGNFYPRKQATSYLMDGQCEKARNCMGGGKEGDLLALFAL